MFIVKLRHPLRPVQVHEVTVKVCKKTVWAIDEAGGRHLVGSSAFQTLASAERCRFALLQKLVDSTFNQRYNQGFVNLARTIMQTLH